MQEFISSLKEAQLESTSPTEITHSLLRFQTEINALFFHGQKHEDVTLAFQEIWKFFLHAASNSNSAVRLAAYRATGAFLLKLSPYFTYIIQNTFSDMSMVATIDVKSSAIIASSFAFISSRISLPYLDKFLDKTPVFHHFTISDPIFSEHLSSIISNLGRLGFDWFSTLLHSFLSLSETSNDRYLMKSITSVISHDPINLMNDFLQYIKEQNSYKKHLSLASYIITSGHICDDSFDLFDLAKSAIDVLNHPKESNPTIIDSAFQILSTKSPSFYLQVDPVGNDTINLTLSKKKPDQSTDLIDFDFTDKKNDNEHISIVINVSVFKIRPTIYLLELPLMYSEPQSDDGALTLAAKFKSLASRINAYPEKTPTVLSTFVKYYNKQYDSTVSAVIQGISECFPTLIKHSDLSILRPLIESVIFTPSTNWFHSADILTVIENMPHESFEIIFGRLGLERVVTLLIEFSMSPNAQVSIRSMKTIQSLVTPQTFYKLTTLVSSHIDIFDDNNLSHLLPLLTDILRDHTNENMSHLHFLVFQLIELQDFYKTNLPVLTSLLHFIGNFTINFVTIKVLRPTFLCAVSIIAASIQCVSGFSEWENVFQFEGLSNMVEIISTDLRSKNIDVSSENALNYKEYLAPCVAALKFLYGIPVNMIQKDFILILYRKLRNIFPHDSAKFVQKFWPILSDEEKIQAILKMHKSLRFVQKYSVASIITNLFIQIYKPEYASRLDHCKNALVYIANYALKNKRYLKPDEKMIFKALLFVTNQQVKDEILKNSSDFEEKILKTYPEIYSKLFDKPNPNQVQTVDKDQFINLIQSPIPNPEQTMLENPCKPSNNQSSSSIIFDFSDSNVISNNVSAQQIELIESQSSDIQPSVFSSSQSTFQSDLIDSSQNDSNNSNNFNNDLLNNFNNNNNGSTDLFNNAPVAQQTNFSDDLLSNTPTNFQQNNKQTSFEDDLFGNQPKNSNQASIEDDLFNTKPQTQLNQKQTSFEDDLFGNQPISNNQQQQQQQKQQQTSFEDDLFSTNPISTIQQQQQKQQTSFEDDLFSTKPNNQQNDLFSNQITNNNNNNHADILDISQPNNVQDDLFSHPQINSQSAIQTDLFESPQIPQPPKSENNILDTSEININTDNANTTANTNTENTKENENTNTDDTKTKNKNESHEEVYIFESPQSDLSNPLEPDDPLVKVQLKKKLRSFTSDELYQILLVLNKKDDFAGMKLVFQYCLNNNIQISLKGLRFSEKVIPYAIRYLRLSKSAELEPFIAPYLNDESIPYLIYLEVAISNPSRYLKNIIDSEKVKKIHMKNFGSIISPAHFSAPELVNAVSHCMNKAKSTRKLWFSLVLIQNTLMAIKEVPPTFIKEIFSLFETRLKELNYFTACQILNILSAKVPNETKIIEFVMQFKSLITASSPELFYVYSILENLSKSGNAIFAKEVPKACDFLLNSHTPSIFITGVQLFTFAQKKLTGDRLQSLMRHSFNHITRRLTKTFKYYPIPEISTPALVNILTLPGFKKQQSSLVSSLDGIIPSINRASFQTYFLVLNYSLSLVDEKQKFADEQAMIGNITKQLISNNRVNNEFFVRLYLKIIRAKAEKMTPKSKQENFIMGVISNFMNNFQENCDFYDLRYFICELLTTVNAFNGFTQLLPIMSSQIFTNSPRFFPTFAGVAMFVKTFRSANSGNHEILNKMNASFVGAGKLMMAIHKSRGFALQLLADPTKLKAALDIALYNDDCEETDLLIQKLSSS